MRKKPGSPELTPVRLIHFHRDDLLPYEQDIYDSNGNLETQVTYAAYTEYGGNRYPSVVTILRPMEEFRIVLNVDKVTQNMKLNDDQFLLKIPDGIEIKNLE
jgi:hypothetical protein